MDELSQWNNFFLHKINLFSFLFFLFLNFSTDSHAVLCLSFAIGFSLLKNCEPLHFICYIAVVIKYKFRYLMRSRLFMRRSKFFFASLILRDHEGSRYLSIQSSSVSSQQIAVELRQQQFRLRTKPR